MNLMVDDSAVLLPALLFAGLGHGHRGVTRWANPGTRPRRRSNARGRLAAVEGSPPQGRLERASGPNVEPSGWYFEFANEWYPDIDDTARCCWRCAHSRAADRSRSRQRRERARSTGCWRCKSDGGWAAFDVDNNWDFSEQRAVRRSQRDARSDLSGYHRTRARSALRLRAVRADHPAVRRGVEYLKRTQEADGSWYGRWGVDYIYGTYLALRGLQASGESDREAYILRAGEWLRSIQNADGGWGESCASYDHETFVAAPSTPSQTAWALLGLHRRRRHHQQQRAQGHRVPDAKPSARTAAGTRHLPPAPDFPACSISVSSLPAFVPGLALRVR